MSLNYIDWSECLLVVSGTGAGQVIIPGRIPVVLLDHTSVTVPVKYAYLLEDDAEVDQPVILENK